MSQPVQAFFLDGIIQVSNQMLVMWATKFDLVLNENEPVLAIVANLEDCKLEIKGFDERKDHTQQFVWQTLHFFQKGLGVW